MVTSLSTYQEVPNSITVSTTMFSLVEDYSLVCTDMMFMTFDLVIAPAEALALLTTGQGRPANCVSVHIRGPEQFYLLQDNILQVLKNSEVKLENKRPIRKIHIGRLRTR